MGGGLMQLVAYGAQDVYLTGSPQITFFKVVYRRHTNFAVEPIPQTFNGASDFGRTVTCTINRNGDLITNMYVNISLPAVTSVTVPWGYVRRLGHAIVQHYKIEIGGSKIDEQYGDWLNIWYELTHKTGQERGYARMIGDVPELNNINTVNKPSYQLYVPLQFWFNRNNGLALPLIALQYHDVRITIDFRPFTQCVNYKSFTSTLGTTTLSTVNMTDAQLIIDYVYLDSEERKRFAQASHEYLIEQLQFTGSESITGTSNKYRLNFNHPSKYLVWATHLNNYATSSNFVAYSPSESGWDKAKERFAKAVWFVTRSGFTSTLSNGVYTYSVADTVVGNEVVSPVADSNAISTLSNYVVAQMIFNTVPLDASGGVTTPLTAQQVLDSIVVLENNFTYDWLSWETGNLASQLFTSGLPAGVTGVLTAAAQLANINNFLNDIAYNVTDLFNYGNYINGTDNPVWDAKLQLNGSDRFQDRDGYYFNYVQPYQHFSNTPADGINVYSFALKPEDHQPSGSCNFSRIDNATLNVSFGTGNAANNTYTTDPRYLGQSSSNLLNIYTVNYNVLRVMSGMAGVAYSN